MARTQNGITQYDKDDPLPFPPDIQVRSRWGFKQVEADGTKFWEAATEADYREAEGKRLGIAPDQVDVTCRGDCHAVGTPPNVFCFGGCDQHTLYCQLFSDGSNYFYCRCA